MENHGTITDNANTKGFALIFINSITKINGTNSVYTAQVINLKGLEEWIN